MKAVLFAIVVLVGVDFAINHGAITHSFFRGLAAFGHVIGEWVYYT